MKTDIRYYQDYISDKFCQYLAKDMKPYPGIPELKHIGASGGLENEKSLKFTCDLYTKVKERLGQVLVQRELDRKFIDERMKSYCDFNHEYQNDFLSTNYENIIGDKDAEGRVVIGPLKQDYCDAHGAKKIAQLPEYLQGYHVTLFGPPDNAKLSINAMNAYHRKLKDEPKVIAEILRTHTGVPKWGADDEDSKTPLRSDLISAGENLKGCLNKTLCFQDEKRGKTYELAKEKLSFPIKRFPGLALPCPFLFYKDSPIPLHLYDFALHLFEHWQNPQGLVFYVPKLENEEEAAYIKFMVEAAEKLIQEIHPQYQLGTVRLIIVLENPRAVFRVNEMMDELYPYFAGASLGWHDYLGSTARLFKEDSNYRIPVKADPDIVIKYIKASHDLLANVVGKRGGIKIGGMYGILPISNDLFSDSFQITIKGFFRDVITQMKRDLSGFWVAHPDFVRIGMAIIEAWKFYAKGEEEKLKSLIESLLTATHASEVWEFVKAKDIAGLDKSDPMYARSLIVADIKESTFIANNHPDEIRYNVFQMLQYLTDWLSGNGCVALPTHINGTAARVMDDLATAERSRWEVWHELKNLRFPMEDFIQIAHEEMNFIRRDLSDEKKIVQVKFTPANAKWYQVAMSLMIKLMSDEKPVEFATELLLPFTIDRVRSSTNPYELLQNIDPDKYAINAQFARFHYYFEICGQARFAKENYSNLAIDEKQISRSIRSFDESEIIAAASFHGNIGESPRNLDAMALAEQKNVDQSASSELLALGTEYLQKFGFKFLISAKGKNAQELKHALMLRMENTKGEELANAREALLEITLKRINSHPLNNLKKKLADIFKDYTAAGVQISIASGKQQVQTIAMGTRDKSEAVSAETLFEIASLSKTYASAFAMEFFKTKNISLDCCVNDLLREHQSNFLLSSSIQPLWADKVQIRHLMSHNALNMHYVKGVKANEPFPALINLLGGNEKYQYPAIEVINEPGSHFSYSGAGYMVLEYLIELIAKDSIVNLTKDHSLYRFERAVAREKIALGFDDKQKEISDGPLQFPLFAAGMFGTSSDVLSFLEKITDAFHDVYMTKDISHETAVEMFDGKDKGCMDFMHAKMGHGVFVVEAGSNRYALHQGANDGYRAIYLYCFAGPDKYKGLSILASGEVNTVAMIALMSQEILKELNVTGVDFSKFQEKFSLSNLTAEEIVNIGYKKLLLEGFETDRPEAIAAGSETSPLHEYNLATKARVLKVTNERFARAENLLSKYRPVFDPTLFGKQGKIMDSWETARHNESEYDECLIELAKPAAIEYVSVSTMYHLGNHAPCVSIFTDKGECLLPKTQLDGHALIKCKLNSHLGERSKYSIRIYPDGGLSRIGLYAEIPSEYQNTFFPLDSLKSENYKEAIAATEKPMTMDFSQLHYTAKSEQINYASAAYGARILAASDEHYAPASSVLSPFRPLNMFDGLESKRSRKDGHFEQVEIELADKIDIGKILLDYTFFINNNPLYIAIDYHTEQGWIEMVSKTKCKLFAGNKQILSFPEARVSNKLRLTIYPDGGINRVQVFKK